jgi:hypothetical protein
MARKRPAKQSASTPTAQPAPAQPAPGQPAPGQPAPAQPAPAQPAPGQPVLAQPAQAQPVRTQPAQVPPAVLQQLLQASQLRVVDLSRKLSDEERTKAAAKRRELISRIEAARKSKVICYLTTLRGNTAGLMAEDAIRVFFDHFLELPAKPIDRLDIFLCSNGGQTTVPWRLVSLAREFCKNLAVIVPYRAYSAATMLAIGADEIVMHPFGELGPIDPTVSNDFNPTEENTGRRLGISVEDVKAYVTFIKSTVGITHEEELVQAIGILAQKVHPLALGNVERFLSQSRMMGRKIMSTHMGPKDGHIIDEIVENLASKLYFHGHPINRREAKEELKLKITKPDAELEQAIWDLYLTFEDEFQNRDSMNPTGDLARARGPLPPNQIAGLALEYELLHAVVESAQFAAKYYTRRRFSEVMVPQNPLPQLKEDVIAQGWSYERAPAAAAPARRRSSSK